MEYVKTVTPEFGYNIRVAPGGTFAYLITNVGDLYKSHPGTWGTFKWGLNIGEVGATEDEAIAAVKKAVTKEIKRLEKNPDPRPSQIRRLMFLRKVL